MRRIGLVLLMAAQCGAADLTLWYTQPAKKGMNEALPIGNGRIGELVYAGVETERLVLNDSSLWTGTEISSDDYSKMGSYQFLGELFVTMSSGATASLAVTEPVVSCPSGQKAFYESEELAHSFDGDPNTKWCVEHHNEPVVWEARLPEAKALTQYAFTSAHDTPQRDPSTWTFAGSNDGKEWTSLDKHSGEPPFAKRGESKTFSFANTTAFRIYRFTFQPNKSMKHFQIGEIALPGVMAHKTADAAPSAAEYRRCLDLATAMHTVTYKSGDVTFRRETFASHPAEVIVLRLSADKPGSCTGTVALRDSHKATTQADGKRIQFAGALSNGLKYEAQVAALNVGGDVQARDGAIEFTKCDSVTLLVAAGTDYAMDYAKKYRGEDPHNKLVVQLKVASEKSFDELKSAHVADFQSLFNRVALDVGATRFTLQF